MKRAISLLLALALLTVCLTGCGKLKELLGAEPKEPVEPIESVDDMLTRCQTACNDVDLGGILDCITPKMADPIRATMKVAGTLGNKTDEELLESVIGLIAGSDIPNATEVCRTLEAEVETLKRDGDKATASLKFSYELDGQKYIGTTDAECECIDGKWYISKLTA